MKIAIVLDPEMGPGYLANAASCIATGLFKDEPEAYGPSIEGESITFIPITKIPILVFKQHKPWKELLKRAKRNKLKYMLFTNEGQSTADYDEYIDRVKGKNIDQINPIGLGVMGDPDLVNKFSGDLSLLK